jgi:two-component system chemotaxis sensor kinase CheA
MTVLLGDYFEDARNHLDALDNALLDMEREHETTGLDRELTTSLLGSLHTLKGNSGMMGFASIQKFIHQLEGVFKRLVDRPDFLTGALINSLFESATTLRNAVEQVGANPQPDLAQETAFLETLADLSCAGAEVAAAPAGPSSFGQAARDSSVCAPAQAKMNVLRVDFERLDSLLNLTGELVIHKTKLNQIAKRMEELDIDTSAFGDLPGAAQLIDKTTGELQEAIMRVRMLPVRHVFQRFPRMVRDLAKQKNKEVELVFSGEDTEIDKTVIDALGEPLLHLLRNSIDHGIEPPAAREAAGKPRAGTIRLSASQESSHITISISDDGAGMDPLRVRRKAEEKGLISPEQQLTDSDIHQLVFLPGFSTADVVSETSGRGVGLDVVKKVIASFNGQIDVDSERGVGTRFSLKMPLTLAIIPALLVDASNESYAIPLSAVLESVKISAADIHRVDGKEVAQLRGAVLQVRRLGSLLGRVSAERKQYYLVVLGRAEKRIGLLVDRLRGQQDVVIKALDDYLGDTTGVSGATILGDGSVVLIVDTAQIV